MRSVGRKTAVTSVTSVTTMKNNKLSMLQGVTKCNRLLQITLNRGFVTQLLQDFDYLLHLNSYHSACNGCNSCNTENIPLLDQLIFSENQVTSKTNHTNNFAR